MRTLCLFLAIPLVALSALTASENAYAGYAPVINCYQNHLPPPGIPYKNVVCQASWVTDNSIYGYANSRAALYWMAQQMDLKASSIKLFVPEYERWVIVCSDVYGSVTMKGESNVWYRSGAYTYPGYQALGSATTTIYNPPSPTCTY